MKRNLIRLAAVALIAASAAAIPGLRADTNVPLPDPDSIIGIEAIVAASSNDAIYSRFGHAMLRFVKADGDFATDTVLSLEADVPANKVSALKGIDGAYPVLPSLDTFGNFWNQYVTTEERPLERYIIPSTPAMRERLIRTLQGWMDDSRKAGKYTFLRNNCVGALARLLERSGFPSTIGPNPIIPVHLDGWLKHSLLSLYPGLEMQSPKILYARAAALLGISAQQLLDGRDWPAGAAGTLDARLSDLEIKQLLLQVPAIPREVRNSLVAKHRFGNGGADLDQVMTYKPVPADLYGVCSDASCMAQAITQANQLWSPGQMNAAVKEDRFVYWLVVGQRKAGYPDEPELAYEARHPESYDDPISYFPRALSLVPELVVQEQLFLRAEADPG